MFLYHSNTLSPNHYKVLSQFDRKKVLVNSDGFRLVSNICPHQQSLISTKDGDGIRVCPYHSWSFDINGNPLTSGRTQHYCKNEQSLETDTVFEWNHLLFDTEIDFKIKENFKDLVLVEERIDCVAANFKIIMDIFLDVDHIQSVHSGVYDLIGINNTDVNWDFYEKGSIQTVEQGALWIAVYPYTMIEWQKGSLFVTVTKPVSENQTEVCVFKYLDLNHADKWKLNEQVWETAWRQDCLQSEKMSKFSETNLEPQKIHFRNFLNLYGIN